jgi:hypothetical protein
LEAGNLFFKANNLRSNVPCNILKNGINFPLRKKNSSGTLLARGISFHKCRHLLIFALITQLFLPPAHSFEAAAPDAGLTIHSIASRMIKKILFLEINIEQEDVFISYR